MQQDKNLRTQQTRPGDNEQTFVMQRSERSAPQGGHLGLAALNKQAPIVFEIRGQSLILPVVETLCIGRRSAEGNVQPDVDLTPFGAGPDGVSRLHLQIHRRNGLVYLTDLGSANGTSLNGRQLIPNAESLLRDGDELCLASMVIQVKYRP